MGIVDKLKNPQFLVKEASKELERTQAKRARIERQERINRAKGKVLHKKKFNDPLTQEEYEALVPHLAEEIMPKDELEKLMEKTLESKKIPYAELYEERKFDNQYEEAIWYIGFKFECGNLIDSDKSPISKLGWTKNCTGYEPHDPAAEISELKRTMFHWFVMAIKQLILVHQYRENQA